MQIPSQLMLYLASLPSRLSAEGFKPSDVAEISDHELISDPARLEHLNAGVRSFHTDWLVEWKKPGPWPEDYFIIGENGAGNYYCISQSGQFPGVKEYDHEYKEFVPWAESLDAYYEEVVAIMAPRKGISGTSPESA